MSDAQQLGELQVSRRGFLRGLLAVGATAAVAPQILLPTDPEVRLPVGPLVDPDYRKWLDGWGRIWQVRGRVRPRTKQEIIAEYLKTGEGRQKLAASMVQPLRTRRDYSSIGRRAFLVEQLPDGALPIYDKDPDLNVLDLPQPKQGPFPLFEIAANPEISLTQIKDRFFDIYEMASDLARAQIQAAEDERVFEVMDKIAKEGLPSAGIALPNDSSDAWAKTAAKSGGWKALARRFGYPV